MGRFDRCRYRPSGIVAGADGNVWFGELLQARLGRLNLAYANLAMVWQVPNRRDVGRIEMLVFTRKVNERIIIGNLIRITVLETGDNEVVLAVEAPAENTIQTGEKRPENGGRKAGS